jgi:hypothetical protein
MPEPNGNASTHAHTSTELDPTLPGTLDADISALAALVSTAAPTTDETEGEQEFSATDLAALLGQLEGADGVARGVESRLDELLKGLDAIIGDLGQEENGRTEVNINSAQDAQVRSNETK